MPLFQIQDDDRPAFVVAETMQKALSIWAGLVREENRDDPELGHSLALPEPIYPKGISYIADDRELIIGGSWVVPLGD